MHLNAVFFVFNPFVQRQPQIVIDNHTAHCHQIRKLIVRYRPILLFQDDFFFTMFLEKKRFNGVHFMNAVSGHLIAMYIDVTFFSNLLFLLVLLFLFRCICFNLLPHTLTIAYIALRN